MPPLDANILKSRAIAAFKMPPGTERPDEIWTCVIWVLLVVLVGYGLHWIRLGVVRKIERLEKQHALEKERARIAHEMHDDLGSSLTQIALLSELASRDLPHAERAGEHIGKILTTTREVFRAMDEIV